MIIPCLKPLAIGGSSVLAYLRLVVLYGPVLSPLPPKSEVARQKVGTKKLTLRTSDFKADTTRQIVYLGVKQHRRQCCGTFKQLRTNRGKNAKPKLINMITVSTPF